MDLSLGRFGDRRLEKGGLFCTGGFWLAEDGRFGCAGLGATGPERCGSPGSCATRR